MNAWVDYAQAPDGELFLATDRKLFIKSPFGDQQNWEQISNIGLRESELIKAIAVCQSPDAPTALIATISVCSGSPGNVVQKRTLVCLRYEFQPVVVLDELELAVKAVTAVNTESSQEQTVQAFLHRENGQLAPLINTAGAWRVGGAISLSPGFGHDDSFWAAGPARWSYAWNYAKGYLRSLILLAKPLAN